MKRVLFASIAFLGFCTASFAQAVSVTKKNEPSKMQFVKKEPDKNQETKVVTMNKVTKTKFPVVIKPSVVSKHAITTTAKTNTKYAVKINGTPDKRFKENKGKAKIPVKKDGTPVMRYKTNKKHS